MSVNLPRSGHPMVTVNRTVLCSRVSSDIFSGDKKILHWKILSHSDAKYSSESFQVLLMFHTVQYFCDVMCSITMMWQYGRYFADSPKGIQYFCHSMLSTLCDSWMHIKHVLLDSQFLLHWSEIYFTNSKKYLLLLKRNTPCWLHTCVAAFALL